jgi:hypothetical protein
MKYLVLSVVIMLSCFAFAGDRSTAASFASAPSAEQVVSPVEILSDDDSDGVSSCGGNICGKGTYCCNASCGTCVPKGMSCTQQSCN